MKKSRIFPSISIVLFLFSACSNVSVTHSTSEAYNPIIDPTNFVQGVDNLFFPLVPGNTFVYEGETDEGFEHVEVVVTSETKTIMGVDSIQVQDTVWLDGVLKEDTLDWYAQDKDGNVWYFGEDTKEYDANGQVSSTKGTWEGGVDGALPGIIMPAQPQLNVEYRQEYYAGEAEDYGKVIKTNQAVSVIFGDFTNCLVTQDWTPLEMNVLENKTYCKGVGLVKSEAARGANGSLELVSVTSEN